MPFNTFELLMTLYRFLRLPAMTPTERGVYKKILRALIKRGRVNVFEYGSGFSTVYYSRFLRKNGADFQFHSVDNNLFWHQKVLSMVDDSGLKNEVRLYAHPFSPFWDKPGWRWDAAPKCGQFAPSMAEEDRYIRQPLDLGLKFDLIVLDGRFRQRCLKVACKSLTPNGIVLIHDAQKKHYLPAQGTLSFSTWIEGGKFYPWQKYENRMWLGSNAPLPV